MMAGRDIVASGAFDPAGSALQGYANLIVHSNATDVSLVSAGRDILYSNFDIAGPGTLEVSAGRSIFRKTGVVPVDRSNRGRRHTTRR
jgi:hypothetical protein